MTHDTSQAQAVGGRIRARRKELGRTLQEVADAAGLSKSFISQVEIGKSVPSVAALEQISAALDVPIGTFVATQMAREDGLETGEVLVVRSDGRKSLLFPRDRNPLQLLTPDLQRQFEVLLAEDSPGEWHEVKRYSDSGEEFGLVLEGAYEIQVGDEMHTVNAGDSIYFSPEGDYRLRAVGDGPCRAIWVATPPAF
ncbi:helix-turn-helix domain-containing protein [Nonomuraea africana]|uniref:Transcriptional regulator with XRE-family HTH domain n=1 Tax=Nonomuraea africana TaxID=46171 RepID=A0ABR9K6R6_9ACTN|nr:XRE family transcriptional regulator [Nonomuraea africana]MBE1557590.1 transcriptional regulator with XRE-family HTH domain [Nonomuraea africana]